MKVCTKCGLEKNESEFNKNKRKTKISLSCWCKQCRREYRKNNLDKIKERNRLYRIENKERDHSYGKEYRKNNPDKLRDKHLRRNYGITLQQYNEMFEKQEGKCAICGTHQSEFKKPLYVDHCHETGKIRGLLCDKCNHAIGLLKDSPNISQEASNYLFKHKPHYLGSHNLITIREMPNHKIMSPKLRITA